MVWVMCNGLGQMDCFTIIEGQSGVTAKGFLAGFRRCVQDRRRPDTQREPCTPNSAPF